MLKPTSVYRSKNFTASLSDDPSGIWFLDVSCKTERNGVSGRVIGHIPLCLTMKTLEDGTQEASLSVMDDVPDEEAEGAKEQADGAETEGAPGKESNVLTFGHFFHKKK